MRLWARKDWHKKQRIRKKRRLGEFKELGFEIRGTFTPGVNHDRLLDDLIDFVESRDLGIGGSFGDVKFDFYATKFMKRKTHGRLRGVSVSCDYLDLHAVCNWLGERPDVADFIRSDLMDILNERDPFEGA